MYASLASPSPASSAAPAPKLAALAPTTDSKAKPQGLIGAITKEPGPECPTGPACFSAATYPLHDSFILDTSANTYVYNNRGRFKTLRPLSTPEYLRAGDSVVAIQGYSTITIYSRTSSGGPALPITLHDVAYVPGYHTSLVSYYTLNKKSGAYLNAKHLLIRITDNTPYYALT